MRRVKIAFAIISASLLSACASMQYGDKSAEADLKKFQPIPGKASLYVCREPALLMAAGVRSVILVNNEPIGTLRPNTFVHAVLPPGKHGVLVRNDGLASGSGGLIMIEPKADEVTFLWVGVTGMGFGALTIDHFNTKTDAMGCVTGADYSVKAK